MFQKIRGKFQFLRGLKKLPIKVAGLRGGGFEAYKHSTYDKFNRKYTLSQTTNKPSVVSAVGGWALLIYFVLIIMKSAFCYKDFFISYFVN